MSRDGSGNYSLPAGNPVVTGSTISSTTHNNTMSDIATALTQSVSKDGQTTYTGNQPMGSNKLTGLSNGSARTDSIALGQVQDSSVCYLTSPSGTNTITASLTSLAAYAAGQCFRFIAAATNTGAVTLNINSLGAKAITKNGAVALVAGDIKINAVVEVAYDGTQFQLMGVREYAKGADIASATTTDLGAATGDYIHVTGTTTITSFGTSALTGAEYTIVFDGALTLTHGSNLLLPGAANITTAAGDVLVMRYDGSSVWKFVNYVRAANPPSGYISFLAHKNGTNQTSVTDGTKITFGTEAWDIGGYFDTSTSRFTPPAGKYRIGAALYLTAGTDQQAYGTNLYKNGSLHRQLNVITQSGAGGPVMAGSVLVDANGTDYYEIYFSASTGSLTIGGVETSTYFYAEQL